MQQGLLPKAMRLDDPNSEVLQWAEDKAGPVPPELIRKAMSKFVDEIIMHPNVVNRPLWMSNPHFAMVAQLKGFMMTFGNTVGMRAWREVAKPLARGRIPLDEALRYFTALMLITAASIGIRELKDILRYGDEESPWEEKEPGDKFWTAIVDSNIFGPGTIVHDALRSTEYGVGLVEAVLGPTGTWGTSNIKSMLKLLQGKPKSLARTIVLSIPILNQLNKETKKEYMESVEESIEDVSEELGDTLWGD